MTTQLSQQHTCEVYLPEVSLPKRLSKYNKLYFNHLSVVVFVFYIGVGQCEALYTVDM